MTVELDFEECLRDSPWFRAALDEAAADAAELETHLEKVLKLCSAVLEAGRVLEVSSRAFAVGLRELAGTPRGDPLVREALEKFCDSLEQMMDSHEELRSCTQSALGRHLEPLGHSLRSLHAAGRARSRAADLLLGALQHHAETPRRRPLEAAAAAAALGGARGVARARGLDYVLQLKVLQDRQKTEILQFVLSLLEAQAAFFTCGHQGETATRDYRGHLGAQLERAQLDAARRRRDLEQRHHLLLQQDLSREEVGVATAGAGPEAPPMEGYLYKRASNAFRTWSRRWFFIQGSQMLYLKRARDPPTVLVEDLRLCTVKPCPDLERRFCFEIVSPSKGLGVHLSKVRSLTLDSWEPELVKLMCSLGNRALNGIYEARVEEMGVKRPPPGCSQAQRESWIRAKYVEKKFLRGVAGHAPKPRPPRHGPAPQTGHAPRGSPAHAPPAEPPEPPEPEGAPRLPPGALLFWAARRRRLRTMAEALARGADPGWANAAQGNRTPLLEAVAANSLLGCEFLLQNGASVNQSDGRGQGPLHLATELGHTGLACLFLKRGADVNAVDADGRDPLTIAMDAANADIVTLLRLAKMREVEAAQGQTGDDTYLDIFRDISLMASDHPEKLARAPPPKHCTL
ncbi:arf-GAP with coiled-coil, ANK repeat and PH domain-containing protein 1 isoform X2 [Taeniopygia guttata]|uniref:arf-GAP with coiled-coil, ANK repeat and PH domain-containing protein 1 isoform X2 n=1 Tax=Taeniopygia guttata TaxID=59729 RepID=UPI003BB86570